MGKCGPSQTVQCAAQPAVLSSIPGHAGRHGLHLRIIAGGSGSSGKQALHSVCAHLWVCRPCRHSSRHLARSWYPPHSGPRGCRACTLLGGGQARVPSGEQAGRHLMLRCSKHAGSTRLTVCLPTCAGLLAGPQVRCWIPPERLGCVQEEDGPLGVLLV